MKPSQKMRRNIDSLHIDYEDYFKKRMTKKDIDMMFFKKGFYKAKRKLEDKNGR